ncbi:DUF6817 domain-containing protein [Actinomadura rugatobispora]|uniref:DUF6817 domain-containing protein n=1 Tax=Actinomadura rugatobispora TaxID=1994 RepID=A0ABW1A4J4_9ACTN|nr:hypothetical protein GCM10010200_042080 [Actinomadura rugatobispora]
MPITAATELLRDRGAGEIAHPGGTLLAHLERVHALLRRWDAPAHIRMAGLTHAFYGADGSPAALGHIGDRHVLSAAVGAEAEELVYFYGACDRAHTHPRLVQDGGTYRDRFTGTISLAPEPIRRGFAEITVANELDVMRASPEMRARHGRGLRELFLSWQPLISEPAGQAVRTSLP